MLGDRQKGIKGREFVRDDTIVAATLRRFSRINYLARACLPRIIHYVITYPCNYVMSINVRDGKRMVRETREWRSRVSPICIFAVPR